MKYFFATAILFCLTHGLAEAQSVSLSIVEEEYLKEKSTIVFVSQTHYPPFEFLGSDGDRKGMCIDLVRWISTEFGFKVHFTDGSFKEAQNAVLSGKADILTSLFYSKKRDEVFDFTKVIFKVPASIFVAAERPDIKGINDLNGKTIAMQTGDYAQEFLEKSNIPCSFVYTTNFGEATDLVIAGKADAIIGDEQIVLYHIFSNNLTEQIKKVGDPLYIGQNSMGAKDPNPLLVSIMNKGIETAQKNGVLDRINKKWIGTRYAPISSWMHRFSPYFFILLGGIFLVALLGWFWNFKLRQMVAVRTKELSKSEKTLRAILAASPLGIGLSRGRVLSWHNPAMARMLGYADGELEGQDIKVLYQEKSHLDLVAQWFKSAALQDSNVPIETQWVRKDGSIFDCQLNSASLQLDEEKPMTIVIAEDITDRKYAEQEKIAAQKIAGEQKKLALVGRLDGKMAHDFNNILGIILGNTELSLMDCKDEEIKKTLELIFEQTLRGKNLTKNLVAFAKDHEPRQEFFRISEKIDLVLNLLKKDLQGIELIREDKPNIPDLLADAGMIEHALVNLIQNSIHATSMSEHPRIIIRTYCLDDKICFEIEDNGCGILQEHFEKIYEPSFTLKGSKDVTESYKRGIKGTGYGMANVKKYLEQHKGDISIVSEFGSGTKFMIRLPVIKKELTIKEKTALQEEIKHFNKYILLVEDEPAISDVQYRILTQDPCHHKVDTANNGQVAMDLFDRNEYDFVSLDYVLPGKINGMTVYNHIRATDKTIPILFVSGNIEFLESIKELKQKDVYVDHLSKPCKNKDYIYCINQLIERSLIVKE